MAAVRKQRFVIPKGILDVFEEHPRFVMEPAPGFWPVDIAILKKSGIIEKLAADKEFNEKFEIVIIPR